MNNYPISVSEIATGMTNVSSTMSAAGNSLEETVALLTAANTTIQDAAKASTGLRTITARIRNTKTELDDLGETMTEANYEELIQALTDANVALTTATGEYRSTYEIMKDIADVWDDMTSMEQAALATAMSGTRQQAIFYSIIEQFQEASGAMETMAESTGTLTESYDVYLESTTAHLNTFKAAYQEFGSDLFQNNFMNSIIDIGTALINMLDSVVKLIDKLGGMKTLLTAIVGIVVTLNIDRITKSLTNLTKPFKNINAALQLYREGVKNAATGTSKLSVATDVMKASFSGAQIAMAGLTIAITAAIAIYSKWKQAQDEARQTAKEAGGAAQEEAKNINELYNAYGDAVKAYKDGTGTKEDLTDATGALCKALGYEYDAIDSLIDKYGELDGEVLQVMIDTLSLNLEDMFDRYIAAGDEAVSALQGSGVFNIFKPSDVGQSFSWNESTEELNKKETELLEAAKILTSAQSGSTGGVFAFSDESIDDVINYYDKLTKIRDILFENLSADELESSDLYAQTTSEISKLKDEVEGYTDAVDSYNQTIAQIDYYQYIMNNGVPKTVEEFEALQEVMLNGVDTNNKYIGTEEQMQDAINTTLKSISQLSDFMDSYEDDVNGVIKSAQDIFDMYGIDPKNLIPSSEKIVNWEEILDVEGFQRIEEELGDGNLINEAMEQIGAYGNAIYDAMDRVPDYVNVFDLTDFGKDINSYIEDANALTDAFTKYRNGNFSNKDIAELRKLFPQLSNYTGDLDDQIRSLLSDMNTVVISEFADQFDDVDSEEARREIYQFEDAVLELGNVVGLTQFSIVMDTETESVDNLLTAINESASATGLTAESVQNLTVRYQELADFDPAKLFELTYNGIHLNNTELKKLEKEYKSGFIEDARDQIEDLYSHYQDLSTEIENCSDSAVKADLYAQRDDIKDQIEDIAMLASQYEGLTSKYNEYLNATKTTNEREGYETIISGYYDVMDTIEHGFIGDEERAWIDMMTYADMSTASAVECREAMESLDKVIEGTSFTKRDFFTVDDNGNATSTGLANFYQAVQDVQDLYNKTWAWTDENGVMHLDFGVDGDKRIAEIFDLDTGTIQQLLRALSECSDFDLVLDSWYTNYMDLQTAAEEYGEIVGDIAGIDMSWINTASTDAEDLTSQMDQLRKIIDDEFVVDGKVDMDIIGAEQAIALLEVLNEQLAKVEESGGSMMLSIDTQGMEGTVYEAVEILQAFLLEYQDYQIELELGVDTAESEQELTDYIVAIASLPANILASLDLNDASVQSAIANVQSQIDNNGALKADAELNPDDIDIIRDAIVGIGADDLIQAGVDKSLVEEFIDGDYTAKGTVNWENETYLIDQYISVDKSATGYVHWKNDTSNVSTSFNASGEGHEANGTLHSHASGTDVSIDKDQEAVVNELGEEGLIRDGILTRIRGGMQRIFLRAGDIIINHRQMEQLDKEGYVTSDGGRGQLVGNSSFSKGTMNAYSNVSGTTILTVSGEVTSYPMGKNSSSTTSTSSSSSSSTKSDDAENTTKIIDWIEIAIDRIERSIDNLATIAKSSFRTLSDRLSATNDEISEVAEEIATQQAGYERYLQQANSVGLSSSLATKVQNGTIDITEYDEDTAQLIEDYQEWYEKALNCQDAILELNETLGELYQDRFEDIATDYENQLSLMEHLTNTYNNAITDVETRGYLVSTQYYEELRKTEQENIKILEKELDSLTDAMSDAVNSGAIAEGSEAWYEMQQEINAVKESIQEATTAVVEFSNAIRDLEWSYFDYVEDQISYITDEADFLISLMSYGDLYTHNGQLTDTGSATMGLHGQNYNVYMAQADDYAEQIKELNEAIAEDPYNTDLLERREELLELQREMILAAEDEKQAIVDMVEEGINLELSALKELIDSYESALDASKD